MRQVPSNRYVRGGGSQHVVVGGGGSQHVVVGGGGSQQLVVGRGRVTAVSGRKGAGHSW